MKECAQSKYFRYLLKLRTNEKRINENHMNQGPGVPQINIPPLSLDSWPCLLLYAFFMAAWFLSKLPPLNSREHEILIRRARAPISIFLWCLLSVLLASFHTLNTLSWKLIWDLVKIKSFWKFGTMVLSNLPTVKWGSIKSWFDALRHQFPFSFDAYFLCCKLAFILQWTMSWSSI